MKAHIVSNCLALAVALSFNAHAVELPYLEENGGEGEKSISMLKEAYASTSPEDLGDGIQVGTLDTPGVEAAVKAFIADDKAEKYQNLDSFLIWKDGKLVFEMYNRNGRVDSPHYTMSVTKTMTSVVLARAIQLGLLGMDDLDKPVIDFMPEIDRGKIQKGVETITLRDALFMKSGLRFKEKNFDRKLKEVKQDYFQKLFENTDPITAASKEYKYTGLNPSMIMMIIDIKTGGKVEDFIKKEVADKIGAKYTWGTANGIPKCGAGSHFTSRSLLKVGTAILQEGKYAGEQWLSPDYVKLIMDTNKGQGYFYYFHNRRKFTDKEKVNFISGIGAGGQYMSIYPNEKMVIVATSTKSKIGGPLDVIKDHFSNLFQ